MGLDHDTAHHPGHGEHVVPTKIYLAVFFTLLVLTAVTVWIAFFDLGAINTVVALGIAGFKTCLVGLFFMHLKYSNRLNSIAVVAGIGCLLLLIFLTLGDTMSRGWISSRGSQADTAAPIAH